MTEIVGTLETSGSDTGFVQSNKAVELAQAFEPFVFIMKAAMFCHLLWTDSFSSAAQQK